MHPDVYYIVRVGEKGNLINPENHYLVKASSASDALRKVEAKRDGLVGEQVLVTYLSDDVVVLT